MVRKVMAQWSKSDHGQSSDYAVKLPSGAFVAQNGECYVAQALKTRVRDSHRNLTKPLAMINSAANS